MSWPGSEAGSGESDDERDERHSPSGGYRPRADGGQPPNGYGPLGDAYHQDGGPRYLHDGNGYAPGGNGFREDGNRYRQASDYRGAGRDDWRRAGPGNRASGDYRPPGFDDRTTRGYEATAEFPASGNRRPPGDVGGSTPGAGWNAGAGRVGNRTGGSGPSGTPQTRGRSGWPQAPDPGAAGTGSGDAQAGGSGATQRRRAGGRAPGAHRAAKAEGLIPGFGRSRVKPERGARRGPEAGGRPERPESGGGPEGPEASGRPEGPWPADVPSPGEAGLTGGGYGVSPEGELTDAELERSWYRQPKGSQADVPTRPRPVRGEPAAPGDAAAPSLVRSSSVMALGTLASRVSGLIRTLVLVYALGTQELGNAYNYANTLPNTVYNLAIGGILTSVIVPLLVSASKRHMDKGEQYDQRMFTLVTAALAGITLVATLAAAPIASLYDPKAGPAEHHLLVIFAYFFIPQIFFYGVSSLAGAILNARNHFAAPMWTPVVNNIVVTVIAIVFLIVAAGQDVNQAATVTNGEILLLGIGTTLGIIAQTAALVPALRRVGFRWHPRFDFRRVEISEIGRMAGWMFGYVLTTQVAFLVTSIVASTAGNARQTGGVGAGFTAYSNAWLLFQLPYAIVAISVITALLPRMSGHAADRKFDLVQADFSTGVRLGSVVVVPAALVLAALGPALGEILLGWGNTSDASARYIGLVFSVFSLGLVPYMMFQLLLRVFYALHDSKTPALIGVATMVANAGANLIALAAFPKSQVVAALGAGFGLANVAGTVLAWRVLSRRLGGLAGREIGKSLLRMHAAAAPAAIFALAVAVLIGTVFSTSKIYSALIVLVGGAGAVLLYVAVAKKLQVAEVTGLMGMVRSRLRR